jgi:hypothetical protein
MKYLVIVLLLVACGFCTLHGGAGYLAVPVILFIYYTIMATVAFVAGYLAVPVSLFIYHTLARIICSTRKVKP